MNRCSSATACLGLLLSLVGCGAAPQGPIPSAAQLVSTAEALLQEDRFEEALATLALTLGEATPKRLRDRRDLAYARAEYGRGQPWAGFVLLEKFSDNHPLSELRPQVMKMLWSISQTLLERDRSFWIFWSDRNGARNVLEHLITRHPDSQRLADALRILGDMAFEDEDYELAQERYREIILERPDSDWRFYANYRFAMSIVASLRGPDYDLDGMSLAVTELRTFLRTAPENPQMLAEAEEALQRVLTWQMQRHMNVVAYYGALDNAEGQLHHARLATREEFRGLPGFDEAVALRERLETEQTQPATASGGNP